MEEELGILFNNSAGILMNETEFEKYEYSKTLHDYLFDTASILITTAEILCDVLIIYIFCKTRRMRTRTNLFLMHVVVYDILYAVQSPEWLWFYVDMSDTVADILLFCIAVYGDALLQFFSLLFIFFIISNTIMKSTKINDIIFISVVDGFLISLWIINVVLCALRIEAVTFILYTGVGLVVLITMVSKEINICCKRYKDPISEETMFRMNIGRIFLYNWATIILLNLLLQFTSYNIIRWIDLSQYMNGIYFFIYLYHADKKFRICVLNIFKCQSRNYDIDATISFAEDCQAASDIGEVNINFNNDKV